MTARSTRSRVSLPRLLEILSFAAAVLFIAYLTARADTPREGRMTICPTAFTLFPRAED